MKLSPLWKQIKEKTALSSQLLKEKTGVEQTDLVDPEFDVCSQHFEIMEEQFKTFLIDIEDILKIIPNILESGHAFSATLKQTNTQTGEKLANVSSHFETFFTNIEKTCGDHLVEPSNRTVLDSLKKTSDKFNELQSIKKQRQETQLLYDNYKQHLEKAEKNDRPDKMHKYTILKNEKKEEWTKLNNEYKATISEMWENRYEMLSHPLELFTGVLYKFCFECFQNLHDLQAAATPEQLMTNFGVDDPLE